MKSVLILSDLHVGSHWGLCPLEWRYHEGSVHVANPGQRFLLAVMTRLTELMKERYGKLDVLVVNGDACDGDGRRYTLGSPPITIDALSQSRCASQLLKPLSSLCRKKYMVRGTEVHDQRFGEAVDFLGESLYAEKFSDGCYSGWELLLDVDGIVFHFAHHIGSSQIPFYRAQQITREIVQAAILAEKVHHANVVVRSHVHVFHESSSMKHWGFTTPCFCLQTPYMIKKSPLGFIPHIGAIVVEVDKDEFNPITIKRFIFPLPPKELKKYA